MLTSHTRLIAATFAGSLSLAACGGGGGPSSMTPLTQSSQRAPETASSGRCKVLPLIDPRTRLLKARSGQNPGPLSCGVRASHKSASRPNTGNIQVFDVPGAIDVSNCAPSELFGDCGTFGIAINASGTIVGYYLNSMDAIAAFIRTPDANYTSFQAHSKWTTLPYDITNGGAIAGQYFDGQGVAYGFVRRNNGSLVGYEAPWASQIPNDSVGQGTSTGAINAGGETGGIYFDSQGSVHGYIRQHGSFVQAGPHGSVTSSVCLVCINNRGTAAGDYTDSHGNGRGFIRSAGGAITTVTKHGAVDTGLTGINNHDSVLGFYIDTNSVVWGLIQDQNKNRVVFQDPQASKTYGNGTQPEAINDSGAVTGLYADAQGGVHGFYRSPTGEFSEFDPQGSVYTEPFAINASGTVTGYWYDAQGANHGFIWSPQ